MTDLIERSKAIEAIHGTRPIMAVDGTTAYRPDDVADALRALPAASDGWQDIESAPTKPDLFRATSGPSILTVGTDQSGLVSETRYCDPGPYVRTPNGDYHKPAGWYWSGWDGAVGPVNPTKWRPLPAPPAIEAAIGHGK